MYYKSFQLCAKVGGSTETPAYTSPNQVSILQPPPPLCQHSAFYPPWIFSGVAEKTNSIFPLSGKRSSKKEILFQRIWRQDNKWILSLYSYQGNTTPKSRTAHQWQRKMLAFLLYQWLHSQIKNLHPWFYEYMMDYLFFLLINTEMFMERKYIHYFIEARRK